MFRKRLTLAVLGLMLVVGCVMVSGCQISAYDGHWSNGECVSGGDECHAVHIRTASEIYD